MENMKTRDYPTPLAQFLDIIYINYLLEQHRLSLAVPCSLNHGFPSSQRPQTRWHRHLAKGPEPPARPFQGARTALPRQDWRIDSALLLSLYCIYLSNPLPVVGTSPRTF